ncbi:MAG: 4-hydroxy-3-methylbut-2-enyl diphosphate reductase [Deltaproteobacteria bacterium]|nr:4-hydroxy-3-methylbut-2-enyl diphosphate reductase [Deltaproteobacteria bacterium]
MKVKLARTAGFCMGVRRAMEIVLTEINKGTSPLYTYGPLIHNQQVLGLLETKGVKAVDDITDLDEGTIIIRAHGIPPAERRRIKSSGLRIRDATCPRVARVQAIISSYTKQGYHAVIVGDKDHPEVKGLMGYANGRAHAIKSAKGASQLPRMRKVFVVAQTTQAGPTFREVVKAIKGRFPDALVFDTICDATYRRQREVRALSDHVDGVVVVGGYNSGNTQRLAQISQEAGMPTFHVETEEELDSEKLRDMEVIGVTAGASTPTWMIKSVVREIEGIQSRTETLLGRWVIKAARFLLLSNVVTAGGAFALAYAAALLAGRDTGIIYPSLAFFYIYAMHVLNRFLDKGASAYNDPEVATFYRKYRTFLVVSGVVSIIMALTLSWYLGLWVFVAMAGLNLLGIVYSVPLVPAGIRHLWPYTRIKDFPGSKTLSEALAWGVVIALLPLLGPRHVALLSSLAAFIFVFSLTYIRSAIFDIFQEQGDLIVGAETLPIMLGEERTLLLLKGVVVFAGLFLIAAPLSGAVGPFAYLLILTVISSAFCLLAYEKRWLFPGRRFEALVEGNFFLAGLLGLIWQILT